MPSPYPPLLPLTPHISPSSIFIAPPSPLPPPTQTYHIFFLPGNPGLLSYYHGFLTRLSERLSSRADGARVFVYGRSGAGFDGAGRKGEGGRRVLGLRGQVEFFGDGLGAYVRGVREGAGRDGDGGGDGKGGEGGEDGRDGEEGREVRVILVGHSVGAYMALEVVRRVLEGRKGAGDGEGVRVVGLVGLWPTVTHIARSASGVRVGWLLRLPHFALVVGFLARVLMFFVSETVLAGLLKLVLDFPDDAAGTTAKFLKSPMGVRQALYMAKDEMNEITEDRWDKDIWVAATESERPRPKLIFYFGKRDHWVADHTRDELIAARAYREGGEEWKPRMLIDEEGIPHSFPIKHGAQVAEIVAGFVDEIIRADKP